MMTEIMPIDTYVCIDLETTGLNPKIDKIIEIGAIRVVDKKSTDTFSSFINPARKLDEKIVNLTKITDKDLEGAPFIGDVISDVLEFIGDLPLLGHNVLFDYSFLKKAAVDVKIPFVKNGIDTLKIARKYLPELEHKNLEYLCNYFGIEHNNAHRALADAEAAGKLYEILKKKFYDEKSSLFMPSNLIYNVKRDTPATKPQKEKLYKLLELHKITPEENIEMLTRSEASRLTDKILSKYGR